MLMTQNEIASMRFGTILGTVVGTGIYYLGYFLGLLP